jgi:hypothetical protein
MEKQFNKIKKKKKFKYGYIERIPPKIRKKTETVFVIKLSKN